MGSTDYMQIPSKILMLFYHRNRKKQNNLQIHIQVLMRSWESGDGLRTKKKLEALYC